jgi:hypothetical protein
VTITIAAAPGTAGAVVLTVTTDNPLIALTRSDRNGTRPVRLEAGALPASGTLTLRDYEPAIAGPVHYRASTAYGTAAVWITLPEQRPIFILPALPLASAAANTVFDYSATRRARATVHEVIGRPDPIIVHSRMGTRSGTLSVLCDDHADLMDLQNLLAQGYPVFYRQAENRGQDMYFHALEAAAVPNTGAWELTITYRELGFPDGPVISGAGWTYADLAAEGGSYAEVVDTYADYTALLFKDTGDAP